MNTINNLKVSELSSTICRLSSLLNFYQREGKPEDLIATLKSIKAAAATAQELMQWREGI